MRRTSASALALLVLLALTLRLGAAWAWQARLPGQFAFGDSLTYWGLGQAVAAGGPYQYGEQFGCIFRTPGYPLLLAPIFWLAGPEASPLWGRALGAVLGALTVVAVWAVGRRLFGPRAALWAAALTAVYPGAIATSIFILSEAPFCPLMLLNLLLWICAEQAATRRAAGWWAFAAGISAGAATLVRPSWLLFLPFATALFLLVSPQRKRHLALAAVMALGLCLTMTPWWIRSVRLSGHFVSTTLQAGASLYDGWNPRATGGSDMYFVPEFIRPLQQDPPPLPAEYPAALEYELDRRLGRAAVAWAQEHPGRVLELALVKFTRVWNIWPNEPAFSRWWVRLGVVASYVPLLLLGIGGAWRTIRRGPAYVVCWLPAVYFSLLHMIFVSSIRYREPAMLGLIVLAAGFLASRFGETTTQP